MPWIPRSILPKHLFAAIRREKPPIRVAPLLIEVAALTVDAVHERMRTRPTGLTEEEAAQRLVEHGPNVVARDARTSVARLLRHALVNPLVVLLALLATVSFATGDAGAGSVMALMLLLSVGLRLIQESRADAAAARLKAMISVTATVVRDGKGAEVPIAGLVPGDVVRLAAGDMIPGDVRFVSAKDLFVVQGALSGESLPVEKADADPGAAGKPPLELADVAYLGTSVESGSALAVVVATGAETFLGGMASAIAAPPPPTAFDRGVARFTWLMLRFMFVMAPLVFLVNGLTKHDWREALFFALAVAVGLTPEMLPMIVTVCLSKGALAMARKRVIVKRINSIQNLGAMDVLCTDKTGTLTMDRVILEHHCDVVLDESEEVLALAYLNSWFQSGLRNVLDRAILSHQDTLRCAHVPEHAKVDEIPFDFQRRIMSVVVRTPEGRDLLIAKGAPEAVLPRCSRFELDGRLLPIKNVLIEELEEEHRRLSADGFRVLAVATRDGAPRAGPYGRDDERELVLRGYVAFLDPPKETAPAALAALQRDGVAVKVITGDNDLVARKICREVGIATERVLLGRDIEAMSEQQLSAAAEAATLFARVSPADKMRIIKALQASGHTVGFMGDGINDAPALRAADVGISVDTAVDIAKESADMILLEKSLLVLEEGVREGRKVFQNILKYIRMGASSSFGNMFSVLGASLFVPFLPMLPIQILTNNLLYDLSQTGIPTDDVDADQVRKPRPWDMGEITKFILFIGPCSSVFDYATFFVMLRLFGCGDVSTPATASASAALFQTGWFVESLLTQTLIVHVIRTRRIPFVQSKPSAALAVLGLVIAAIGAALPYSPLARHLGFVPLPAIYWPLLLAMLLGYVALTQGVKAWLIRRNWL